MPHARSAKEHADRAGHARLFGVIGVSDHTVVKAK